MVSSGGIAETALELEEPLMDGKVKGGRASALQDTEYSRARAKHRGRYMTAVLTDIDGYPY